MPCLKCNKPPEREGLCNVHYHLKIWADNTNIDDLGIVKFADSIVPGWARNETAFFQKEVFWNFFRLYSKDRVNKYDRLLQEIAFRGAAKTTGAKILLLYICCFGLEKFCVYCSETNTFAVNDIFDVRKELGQNPLIRSYFGVINSKKVKGQDGEWSRDAFLTSTGVNVLARGVGQQIRSALKDSYRPTLCIVNDMYSKDSVKTEYTRQQYRNWFFNDLMNAIDDIDGKVFFNGTILHEDTVPVTLEKNKYWKTLKYPVMDLDHFLDAVKLCKISEKEVILPSKDIIMEHQKKSKLAWASRLNLHYILTKYSESYTNGELEQFYQEYFHIVVPPGERNFTNLNVVQMRYFRQYDRNWLEVRFTDDGEPQIFPVNVFLGVDPASSNTSYAKYSVIFIMMMNQHRQVFWYGYSRGKYGLRDEFHPEYANRKNGDIVEFDKSKIKRLGIVDEELRLARQYNVDGAQIETTQAQEHIYTEVARLMRHNDILHRLYSDKPVVHKEDRDADMLVPDFQANAAFVNLGLDDLMNELKSFPRGSTIDIIDAAYHARKICTIADDAKIEEVKATWKNRDQRVDRFERRMALL